MTDPRREQLKQSLRASLDQTIEDRIDRYLSVAHQMIIGDHHFAHASSECLSLYRDGYFTSCITVTQAVSEGILKFIAERNTMTQANEKKLALAAMMQEARVVTKEFVEAFGRIQGSYRNDFHHMNPPVATVGLSDLAMRNIKDLATMEHEVFGFSFGPEGTLVLNNSRYWDVRSDGSVPAYIRGG